MATTSTSHDQSKSVDPSLWWDSFTVLLTELEHVSVSSDLPPSMVKKLKDNHAWFLGTVSLFKPPSQKSREALDSRQVIIGSHQLAVLPELKDSALKISSVLRLDEVQSYILVKRSIEGNSLPVDPLVREPLHLVMLQYHLERQCLLKCTRQILMHALYVGDASKEGQAMREEAEKLISDGLESRLLSVLEDLLSCSYPDHMDVDLYTLWAEEILIEDNLVLDNLFLAYYESFCTCSGQQWKRLCLLYEGMISGSYNFGKLALSTEATHSVYHAKVQLLLILVETLDLENLLQMIHDETPFRQGVIVFSVKDIQEIDAIISGLDVFGTKEAGPLILTWAVFLCLVSSLPEKQEYNVVMEIDHVGYVRQAFEAASLNYFLEILQSTVLTDSDGPIAGYRSILRTFISSFIASYEISLQLEDNNLKLILEILGKIYRGEESLCSQFWDRDSFIDGPIRCLLCNLEGEFPFRTSELVRLLSALAEGTWPAECVYTFLDKSVGLSSLFKISSDTVVDSVSHIVETQLPLSVPGLEGLVIPSRTRGHVLKVIDGNTALVRWEYTQSGVLVLLLRLVHQMYLDGTEEVLVTLDLLGRLVTFNTAVCYALMDTGNSLYDEATQMNGNVAKVNVIEIICSLVKNMSPNCNGAVMMSMGVNILAKMLKCSPCHVTSVALKGNIFDVALQTNPFSVGSDGLSSGSWLLSGRLAKMLLIDCEHNDSYCPLTLSVIDFTMQLVETGVENDITLALVTFSVQYVLVNHDYWKYKVKDVRWNVTLKVLEMIKKCILSIPYSQKLGEVVRDILLCDSSVHSALFRIVCTTTQALEKLYISRHYELVEIEGLQLAICSVLDILSSMLSDLLKDALPSVPVFHQAVLSSTTKPIPVFTAVISLISFFRNPTIQVGAARVLSKLFVVADYSQPYVFGNACFGLGDNEIADFRGSVIRILQEQYQLNEDLIVAMFQMLTSAADFQPAFLVAVIDARNNSSIQSSDAHGVAQPTESSKQASFLDALLQYVRRSGDLIKSNPSILLNMLNFLKSLWQGAAQFANILELLKSSAKFWKQLSSILLVGNKQDKPSEILTDVEALSAAYKYQCQSDVLQIMAYELFLQKKLIYAELQAKHAPESSVNRTEKADAAIKTKDGDLNDIFSTWCKSSELGHLINSYASCPYDNGTYLRAKIAGGLLSLHVMGKLKIGDTGSLSVSLIEKISILLTKLTNLPAFSELVTQYSQRGYSDGKELNSLILSDLYYHMQGELEGRKIHNGPFKELYLSLVESKFLHTYQQKYDGDLSSHAKDVDLFDLVRLRADLGLDLWDFLEWRESKAVAEKMLLYLQEVNSMVLLAKSKISALKALISTLSVYNDDSTEKKAMAIGGNIPEQLISPFIDQVCQCLHATIESLAPVPDAREEILDFISSQVELLLHLIRYINKKLPLPTCVAVLKTSGSGLKVLSDLWPAVANVRETMKLLLMLLLSSVELSSIINSDSAGVTEMESVEAYAEASNASLGLLPILCKCTEPADHCAISLTTVDLILKGFLTPGTWFPIIQKHLQLLHLVHKLQDKNSLSSVPVILKFLLTLARVREGAKLLINAGFFASLRELLTELSDGRPHFQSETSLSTSPDKVEKPQHIWGLGLAVVTAVIHSLGGTSSCADIVDYVMAYFFAEKSYLISFYLNEPYFPSDVNNKKTAYSHKTLTTLSALKETEQTLMLICLLAKHRDSWIKAMKVMDSQLRERSIHLLAFISRGNQRLGESPLVPLLCHPTLKEEFEWYKKPSLINSRNGWFALSPLGCGLDPRFSNLSSRATVPVTKDRATDSTDPDLKTYFSDITAIQMYRITFLLLKFLCLQAEGAAKRAEEVGFVDVAHFPELPMPDILHGLQDQGIAIVYELCEANKLKQVPSEMQGVCTLLVQITEMALYLEYCVSQLCGIRPVLGRVEDFSKELKLLLRGSEGHVFLKEYLKSLKQIISFVYPGLLETEGFL